VARVEKRLNRVDGATATVNLPLESAHVVLAADVSDADLVAAVEKAGYTARVTTRRTPVDHASPSANQAGTPPNQASASADRAPTSADRGEPNDEAVGAASDAKGGEAALANGPDPLPGPDRGTDLRRRLRVAAVLTVPVLALSMVPALQLTGWQWVVAALALPVVTWAAWPFHTAAFRAARHGASTMDTLVSLGGVGAAALWSLGALLRGGAGELGMRMQPTLVPSRDEMGVPELYFEVAAVVTTFLLAGRYAEHRSKRRAGDALRSLLELGAKDAERVVLGPDGAPRTGPDGARVTGRVPVADLAVGDVFVVRPGEKVATDGVVLEGASAVDTSLLTGEPVPVDVGPGDD